MLATILITLLVLIVLVIKVLYTLSDIVESTYSESLNSLDYTQSTRPSDTDYCVGDLVFIRSMNANGVVVSADLGEYDVCTDVYGNEVFEGIGEDDLELRAKSYLAGGHYVI